MSFTEDFKGILARKKDVINANLFIFKNDNPTGIKVFPEEVSSVVLEKYFDTLAITIKEKEFVSFIPTEIEPGTLQVIDTEYLTLWPSMKKARQELQHIDTSEITIDDYRYDGNTILMDIEFNDGTHVFFLTTYRNVSTWYSNSIRFIKNQKGKFHEEKGDILALTLWVDVVIFGESCYILNEANFNKIFKFDGVINHQITSNEAKIRSMKFIDDKDSFMNSLQKSVRYKNAMAKVIMQKRLDKINKFSARYIREQIEKQPELSFISYTSDDKIIIDKKSFKAVIDILCGKINLDLITKELNGLIENE